MMRDFYHPQDAAEIEQAKLKAAVDEFLLGKISDDVFLACLHSRGFRSAALRCEFRYWADLRHENATAKLPLPAMVKAPVG